MEIHVCFSHLHLVIELYVSQNIALEYGMLSWVYVYRRVCVCRTTCLDPPLIHTDLNLCFGKFFILVSVGFCFDLKH